MSSVPPPSPPRPLAWLRNAWVLVGLCLALLALLEFGCRLWIGARAEAAGPNLSPGLRDEPWAEAYQLEFLAAGRCRWEPYVYWRRQPFEGRWIHVDAAGLRRTWRAPQPAAPTQGPDPARIFVFGGSTVWGTGARDDHTLPSELARVLHGQGIAAEVTNFGETGYVSKQGWLTLLAELERGSRPHLVIFYDGANDTYAAYQSGQAGLPHNEWRRREQFHSGPAPAPGWVQLADWALPGMVRAAAALRRRTLGSAPAADARPPWPAEDPERRRQLAAETADHYAFVVERVRELGAAHGFRTLFLWQPTAFQKAPATALEERAVAEQARLEPFLREAYRAVREHPGLNRAQDVLDLSTLFTATPEALFLDWCHLSEEGNRRVAEALGPVVQGALAAR